MREAFSYERAAETPTREDTSHVSHITRRRMVSEPAEEVSLDEVTLIDEAAEAANDAGASTEPTSVAPLAMDVSDSAPINVPITKGPTERPQRSRAPMVISAVALCIGVAAGAFVQRGVRVDGRGVAAHAGETAAPKNETVVTQPETSVTAPLVSRPADAIPQMDVAALPKAKQGTVVGLSEHRLWIDGKLAESWKALVDCGPHLVQVGSAGTPRTVDVPCGDEIKAQP